MSGDAVSGLLEQSKKPAGDGPTVFAHACQLGLEGIVSKRKDSVYRSGRSPDWDKMKNPRPRRGRGKRTGARTWTY
jgi:bifunctional non-homologous end joining protein LigD